MRTSAKKARGRPRGRTAPHRPVLSVRVPEELYEKIQTSARANGRTVSEEAVWRTQQSYEWEARFGEARAVLAESRRIFDANLEAALRKRGYLPVAMLPQGKAWISPDADKEKLNLAIDVTKLAHDMLPGLETALRYALGNLAKTEKQS